MRTAAILGALIVALGLIAAFNRPIIAATFCPACFGFRAIAPDVYIERDDTDSLDAAALANVRQAKEKIALFFGGETAAPMLLICTTESHYRALEGRQGKPKAITWAGRTTLASPRGDNVVILTHELAHAEWENRLKFGARSAVPAWFNEGLAAYISDDPRYIGPGQAGNRCLASPDGPLPTSEGDWDRAELYPKAACRVNLWLASRGGHQAIIKLIGDLNRAMPFDRAYGAT
jgi:hypothetical protein